MADRVSATRERFERWGNSLPRCLGGEGGCDGNLVGLEHELNCPRYGLPDMTSFDVWFAGWQAATEEVQELRDALQGLMDANRPRFAREDGALLPRWAQEQTTAIREAERKAEALLAKYTKA